MNFIKQLNKLGTFIFSFFAVPLLSKAHEVYIIEPEQVDMLVKMPAVSFVDIFLANVNDTLLWGGVVAFIIVSVFIVSISTKLEDTFDKHLVKLKKYAPFIVRITIGISFIACGYYGALFGPELPFDELFGSSTHFMQLLFAVLGAFILFGVFTRVVALISLFLFLYAISIHGAYMATYSNFFASFFVLILIGGHKYHLASEKIAWWKIRKILCYLADRYGEFAFFIMRIGFGFGLIYAAIYAKVLHNQLAITVVNDFNLVEVFGFSAEFIVMGAGLIEILLGVFFILGLEVRFTAMVITVFLTLSQLYFQEDIWPHIILIGIPIAFFCYGYDKYSLEGYFFKKGNREPIF